MSQTKIPGMCALHAVITPNCRIVQGGPTEAFDEAVRRLREQYDSVVAGRGSDGPWDGHLVFTVEPLRVADPPGGESQ